MKTILRTMAIATLLLAMSQSMWAGDSSQTYKWARVKVVCPIAADKVYLFHDNGEAKKLSGTPKPIPDNTESANEVDWTLILHSWNKYAVYVHGIPSNDDEIFVGVVEDYSYLSNPIGHFDRDGGYDDDKDGWKQPMEKVLEGRNGIDGKSDGDDSADDKLTYQTACNRVYAWKDDPGKNTDNSYYPQDVDKTYYAVFMKKPEVTLGEDGIATFSYPYGLYVKKGDQAKLKIYGAKLVDGKIKLNDQYDGDKSGKDKRAEMPGNTGVILIGEPGSYTFKYDPNGSTNYAKNTDADNPYKDGVNVLKSTAGGEIVQDDSSDKTYYCLGKKNGVLGFYKVKDGQTIPANKAYIEVSGGGAKDFIGFSDDAGTTAIANIIGSHIQNDDYYNMQGQSVKENYRGIIIKEGKKYINK